MKKWLLILMVLVLAGQHQVCAQHAAGWDTTLFVTTTPVTLSIRQVSDYAIPHGISFLCGTDQRTVLLDFDGGALSTSTSYVVHNQAVVSFPMPYSTVTMKTLSDTSQVQVHWYYTLRR